MRTAHVVLLACLLGLCLGIWLQRAWRRAAERRRARNYNQRGQRAERDAAQLLEAAGYSVVARQLRTKYAVAIGGAQHEVSLILDFVVERRGERFAAEVKSSASASRLDHAETRRQLLEYQLALGARRVLLVDAVRGHISEIEFPIPAPQGTPHALRLAAVSTFLLLISAAGVWLLVR